MRLLGYAKPTPGDTVGAVFNALTRLLLVAAIGGFAYGKASQGYFATHEAASGLTLGVVVFCLLEAAVLFVAVLIRQYCGTIAGQYRDSYQRVANRVSVGLVLIATPALAGYVWYSILALMKR
jgi:hypothetical protein